MGGGVAAPGPTGRGGRGVRGALLERFANARMHDRLDWIAADGSQKLSMITP
jgi:mannitol-1-phosphate/altronate dehydrogenase